MGRKSSAQGDELPYRMFVNCVHVFANIRQLLLFGNHNLMVWTRKKQFDKLAEKVLSKVQKNSLSCPKTKMKLCFFQKLCLSSDCSSAPAEFSFNNTADVFCATKPENM